MKLQREALGKSDRVQNFFWLGALFLLIYVTYFLGNLASKVDTPSVQMPYTREGRMNTSIFKLITFGHSPVAVDLLLIKALGDPAYSKLPKGIKAPIFFDLDLATDLDPEFFELYWIAGGIIGVIRSDAPSAVVILEKGVKFIRDQLPKYSDNFKQKHWSSAYLIPATLAYLYLFELGEVPKAIEVLRVASSFEDAPMYIKSLYQKLKTPGGAYEVGLRVISQLARNEKDPNVKPLLEEKRDLLALSQYLYLMNLDFRKFLQQRKNYQKILTEPKHHEEEIQAWVEEFLKQNHYSNDDPMGGKVYFDFDQGKITSTTPRPMVMGLE